MFANEIILKAGETRQTSCCVCYKPVLLEAHLHCTTSYFPPYPVCNEHDLYIRRILDAFDNHNFHNPYDKKHWTQTENWKYWIQENEWILTYVSRN